MDKADAVTALMIFSGILFLANHFNLIKDATMTRLTNVITIAGVLLAIVLLFIPNSGTFIPAETAVSATETNHPTSMSTNTFIPSTTPEPTRPPTITQQPLVSTSTPNPPTVTPQPPPDILAPPTPRTVKVYRWRDEVGTDWATLPENIPPAAVLTSTYVQGDPLFYAWAEEINNGVAVYCWYLQDGNDWVTIRDDTRPDHEWKSFGYIKKTFLFYASKEPVENGVAVYRWFHPIQKDWVDVPDGFQSDDQLKSWGYDPDSKTFLFYARDRP